MARMTPAWLLPPDQAAPIYAAQLARIKALEALARAVGRKLTP